MRATINLPSGGFCYHMNMNETNKALQTVWDYMQLNQALEKADALFVLCSHDIRVAEYAVELHKAGLADWIIFSGGAGELTKNIFAKPEAEIFAEVAIRNNIPEDKIIIESNSTNTGENITFTAQLLESKHLRINSFVLVQKPYMERRTYATFAKQWPDGSVSFQVTSPRLTMEAYLHTGAIDKETIINAMVGDMQRIIEYPKLGFQIVQVIPDAVMNAYNYLVGQGFNKHLIK